MPGEEEGNERNSCCFLDSDTSSSQEVVFFHVCACFLGSVTVCAGKSFQEELTDRSRCKEVQYFHCLHKELKTAGTATSSMQFLVFIMELLIYL